ncbi:site-specific DNA-methyltransferase [Mycoplasma sp. ES3157-GEN-MYC]|uniref:DNA-methyltransferase n=1 Tax=Mycoplasma miroungigenitalium TaxID=754515 RepID=UPI001C0FC301|nr:site-specific DNA-methyltransferase [Mycoplasma miroungigenitalium]MBU4690567.1 site-specific DNA-methyltransferase [Mycoplasma miroungigenitalium]MBU4691834.1 site-specific DNA-methyltransferase [Mycoplasma miroungigenitalium]
MSDKSIDLICIDPPYGKINGMILSGQKKKVDWDENINWSIMFQQFNRVIKDGGTIVCFGQNPTYAQMILANLKDYKYELIWEKNNAAQGFHADKMPLNFTENIAIFIHNENKKHKRTFNNIATKIAVDKQEHFCRWYAQQMQQWIDLPRRQIHQKLGHRKLEFWFYFTGEHFGLLSETLYQQLIEKFNIDQWKEFVPYNQLKTIWSDEKERTKGVKLNSSLYNKTLNNILKISKENIYLHPTQKPVELIEKLILMYSKEGDIVLDCFLGSGSTGVAAIKNNRSIVGCELNKEYFEISEKRIKIKADNKNNIYVVLFFCEHVSALLLSQRIPNKKEMISKCKHT